MDILCVGEMVIDFLPGGEGIYIRKPGGAPANVAVAMARQGRSSAFCGTVGNDDFGRFLLRTLEENSVKPLVRLVDEAITTMAFVSLKPDGDRSFTFARKPGADMFLTEKDIADADIDGYAIVHAGSCSLSRLPASAATEYALKSAGEKGKLVSFDVNYRDLLWNGDRAAAGEAVRKILPCVDLLKISEEETDLVGGEEELSKLRDRFGISVVVETLGSKGARCFFNGGVIESSAIVSECVDATGAGDAFWGGFLSHLLNCGVREVSALDEKLLKTAMDKGNIAGAYCIRKKGAMESLPTAEEISAFERGFQS